AGVLEEVAGVDHRLELVGRDEMVVLRVAFARPRRARGERDRQADLRIAAKHRIDDAALAGTRRRGDDEKGSTHGSGNRRKRLGTSGGERGTRNEWEGVRSERMPPCACSFLTPLRSLLDILDLFA